MGTAGAKGATYHWYPCMINTAIADEWDAAMLWYNNKQLCCNGTGCNAGSTHKIWFTWNLYKGCFVIQIYVSHVSIYASRNCVATFTCIPQLIEQSFRVFTYFTATTIERKLAIKWLTYQILIPFCWQFIYTCVSISLCYGLHTHCTTSTQNSNIQTSNTHSNYCMHMYYP